MRPNTIIAILGLILGGFIQFGGGIPWPIVPPAPPADVLGECYVADRASTVRILTEMAGKEFADDAEQADWFNAECADARADDFQPFIDSLTDAIVAGEVLEFAESLK